MGIVRLKIRISNLLPEPLPRSQIKYLRSEMKFSAKENNKKRCDEKWWTRKRFPNTEACRIHSHFQLFVNANWKWSFFDFAIFEDDFFCRSVLYVVIFTGNCSQKVFRRRKVEGEAEQIRKRVDRFREFSFTSANSDLVSKRLPPVETKNMK